MYYDLTKGRIGKCLILFALPMIAGNLLQAQRDFFGAHRYERVDRPRGETFHTEWI